MVFFCIAGHGCAFLVKRVRTSMVVLEHNGLAFSCGERAETCFQKANDLARKPVSWNGGLGR